VSSSSGALSNVPYNFSMRFENETDQPRRADSCSSRGVLSMALCCLRQGGMTRSPSIDRDVTLEKVGDAFTVTASHLDTTVRIPNADTAKFQEAPRARRQAVRFRDC